MKIMKLPDEPRCPSSAGSLDGLRVDVVEGDARLGDVVEEVVEQDLDRGHGQEGQEEGRARRTRNMLPKLELAPILMYLMMLAKTLRPSMMPSSSTRRLFSRRMMSADSLATSTAVSTEMPTSAACMAGASLMPSPMKPTTWPAARRALDDASPSASGVRRAKTSCSVDGRGEGRRRPARRARVPVTTLVRGEADVVADLAGDELVVAGEDLHPHAVLARASAMALLGRVLGRIEEGEVAEQDEAATRRRRRRPPCRVRNSR